MTLAIHHHAQTITTKKRAYTPESIKSRHQHENASYLEARKYSTDKSFAATQQDVVKVDMHPSKMSTVYQKRSKRRQGSPQCYSPQKITPEILPRKQHAIRSCALPSLYTHTDYIKQNTKTKSHAYLPNNHIDMKSKSQEYTPKLHTGQDNDIHNECLSTRISLQGALHYNGTAHRRRLTSQKSGPFYSKSIQKEQLMAIKKVLTLNLIQCSIKTLYHDRIRPLLMDVFQRLKHQLKAALAVKDVASYPNMNNKYHLGNKASTSMECTSAHSKINEPIQDTNTDAQWNGLQEQQILKAIEGLDVLLLYVFIKSECADTIILKPTAAQCSPQVSEAAQALSALNFSTIVRFPAASPQLIHYINHFETSLVNPPKNALLWIDPHTPENPYSELTWRSFGAFLTSRLTASSKMYTNSHLMPYQFKGGRYGLAQELQKAEFPALNTLSLGELCHLVQLAIAGRLLAYENSVLQPVASCTEISGTLLRLDNSQLSETKDTREHSDHDNDASVTNPALSPRTDNRNSKHASSEKFASSLTHVPKSFSRPSYNSLEELANDLDILLESKPEGLVTAQLKKSLVSRFGKDVVPQKLGCKKLTECLTQNPAVSQICLVVCLNPLSDCLLLIHRQYLRNSPNSFRCISKSLSDTTFSSDCSGPFHSLMEDASERLDCSVRKKTAVQIPDATLAPVPALMNITFNAWAAGLQPPLLTQSRILGSSLQTPSPFTSSDMHRPLAMDSDISRPSAITTEEENDDMDVFDSVQKIIVSESKWTEANSTFPFIPSAYASHWDCFLNRPDASRITVT